MIRVITIIAKSPKHNYFNKYSINHKREIIIIRISNTFARSVIQIQFDVDML